MDEEFKGLRDYLDILRRRKNQLIVPALVILLSSTALALSLPSIYRSSATIQIEQQEIPQYFVRTNVTSYADQRIQLISQRVMTNSNLGKIIEDFDLYADDHERSDLLTIVDKLKKDIHLEMVIAEAVDPHSGRPTEATIAFTLSYDSKTPELAQKVANEVVSLYLNENLKARTKAAKETLTFLAEEAHRLNKQVSRLEAELAKFKERNIGNLPDMLQLNLQQMDRIERQLTDNEQQIRILEERKIYLLSELAQINPNSKLLSATGERILSTEDELRVLRVQYVSRSAQYKENHPTLVMMREKIEALEREVGSDHEDVAALEDQLEIQKSDLANLIKRYADKHPEVENLKVAIANTEAALKEARRQSKQKQLKVVTPGQPDNPVYIQLQTQLKAAEAEISSLKYTRHTLQAKLMNYEQRLTTAPQVEREFRILTRDYDNAKAQYQEISAKLMEAELVVSLENESKGERFTLLEPPLLPEVPIKPNRLTILFLGFVFSFMGGIGNIAIRESMDHTVRGAKGVISITKTSPLAVIPYIENNQDRRRRTNRLALLFLTTLLIFAAIATAVHFLLMPLDVLWYVILRKLGIEAGV